MINFEHDKTLIIGADFASRPDWTTRGVYETLPLPRIASVEWTCPCGASGPGFPPEPHASGACEVTRTTVLPTGYVDGGGI